MPLRSDGPAGELHLGTSAMALSASLGARRPTRCHALSSAVTSGASWLLACFSSHGARGPVTAFCAPVLRRASVHYIHPWRQVAAAEEDLLPLSHLHARRRAQGELPSVPPLPASCG